ncbi:hypothetical protein D9757_004736 [Collybiopsis confluens]|uniref:Uncharacterized protein n=1 Tax=Collybiopsis confluens TaxID=2823264 RepID=A0A8H5MCJ1_9AGAR|nr:hypothetical protein D9757_004736 [Collybiopsis confluens]
MSLKQLSYIVLTPRRVQIPGEKPRRQRSTSAPSHWLGRLVLKTKSLRARTRRNKPTPTLLSSRTELDPDPPSTAEETEFGNVV